MKAPMKLKNCNAGFYVFLTFPEDFFVFLIFNYSDTTCYMKDVGVSVVTFRRVFNGPLLLLSKIQT